MSFDAGSIIARLDLDDDEFARKLAEDVRKVEEFEKRDHEIKITPEVDKAGAARVRHDIEQIDRQVTADAHRRGGLLSMLTKMFSSSGTGGPGGASGTAAFHRNLLAAAGPGIAGIGAKGATIGAAIPLGLAALPALAAPAAALGVGGLGVGVAALGAKELIGTKQQKGPLYAAGTAAAKDFTQGLRDAAGPILGPLRQVLGQVPQIMRQIEPSLRAVFAGAATLIQPVVHGVTDLIKLIGPGLGQAFRAAAPLMRPLLDGIGQLVRGLLPGLVALLRAAHPAIVVFAQILGTLGRDLGGMLRAFAPVLRQSSVILKALLDVVSALFPIIGRLAAIFARALAPVFVQFAGVIRSLLPFLVTLGRVLASFAAAVIKDLASALGAVAVLLRDLAPSFRILAAALGRVFTIMENAGVFQTLANALYQVAPVLAKLINDLMRQLAPDLPVIIRLVSQLATILVDLLAAGLDAVLQGVDYLVRHFGPLIKWLGLAAIAEYAFGAAMAFVAANPVVAIIAGIVLLIGAIVLLVKHWGRAWSDIKNWARDAWQFLTHGWGQYLVPELYVIRKVVEFVRDHWRQAWNDMKSIGQDAWHFLHDNVLAPMINFFTKNIPDAFSTAVHFIGQRWNNIKDIIRAPVAWVIDHVLDGLISVFDWITSHIGLGKPIKPVHPFGLQAGGRIPGYGGGDRHMVLAEGGEAVVSKETTSAHSRELAAWGVPGFQHGGVVGNRAPGRFPGLGVPQPGSAPFGGGVLHDVGAAWRKVWDVARISNAVLTGNSRALSNAFYDLMGHGTGGATAELADVLTAIPARLVKDAVSWIIGQGGVGSGSGAAIAKYAMSWLGKVPYRWGGTAVPGGADCSGFTEFVYKHFGYNAPRTSEAQGAWVHRTQPAPGALVFFNSPAGGPPPGHVGIALGGTRMVSQAGPEGVKGPTIGSVLGRMYAGVPPGGFARPGTSARGRYTLPGLESLWQQGGGRGGMIAHIAGAIGLAESGGANVVQQGQPYGTTGWGIWQITPGNSEPQFGVNRALLQPLNNARAAVAKWQQAGGSFTPWTTYTSGAFSRFMDRGGWLHTGEAGINAGRGREAVLTPAQSEAFVGLAGALHESARTQRGGSSSLEAKLDRLIRAVERSAGQTGQAVGDALNGAARSASYRASYSVR